MAIDETVTHVLAHEVGRAEDPLARASAGAVLVRPEWLRESVRLGRLQDEGRYAVPHAQPPPRLLAADSTRVAETPAPAPLGDATSRLSTTEGSRCRRRHQRRPGASRPR